MPGRRATGVGLVASAIGRDGASGTSFELANRCGYCKTVFGIGQEYLSPNWEISGNFFRKGVLGKFRRSISQITYNLIRHPFADLWQPDCWRLGRVAPYDSDANGDQRLASQERPSILPVSATENGESDATDLVPSGIVRASACLRSGEGRRKSFRLRRGAE
jgi:hypothetical protein